MAVTLLARLLTSSKIREKREVDITTDYDNQPGGPNKRYWTGSVLTPSGMSECMGCGGGGNLNDDCNLVDVVATHPRTVDTDDREREGEGSVDCLLAAEGASSLAVENHDDACLDSALQSLSLIIGHVK